MPTTTMKKATQTQYAKVLNASDLPPMTGKSLQTEDTFIREYLLKLATTYIHTKTHCCLLMPSLKRLSQLFQCPYTKVQQALRDLEECGYQAITPGLYGQISVWGLFEH